MFGAWPRALRSVGEALGGTAVAPYWHTPQEARAPEFAALRDMHVACDCDGTGVCPVASGATVEHCRDEIATFTVRGAVVRCAMAFNGPRGAYHTLQRFCGTVETLHLVAHDARGSPLPGLAFPALRCLMLDDIYRDSGGLLAWLLGAAPAIERLEVSADSVGFLADVAALPGTARVRSVLLTQRPPPPSQRCGTASRYGCSGHSQALCWVHHPRQSDHRRWCNSRCGCPTAASVQAHRCT